MWLSDSELRIGEVSGIEVGAFVEELEVEIGKRAGMGTPQLR